MLLRVSSLFDILKEIINERFLIFFIKDVKSLRLVDVLRKMLNKLQFLRNWLELLVLNFTRAAVQPSFFRPFSDLFPRAIWSRTHSSMTLMRDEVQEADFEKAGAGVAGC